jgi:hypothetical protein
VSTPTYKNLTALIEQPESGAVEYGDITILTKVYRGTYANCLADALSKGTAGSGATAGFQVQKSTVVRERGDIGKLTIVWEANGSGGGDVPPDEVAVSPDNQSPRIERHPMFISLETIADELALVEDASRSQDQTTRDAAYAKLSDLGKKLVDKIRRGNETYYLAGLRYAWVTHYYTTPTMYRGGWIESPGGPLTGYFSGDIGWLREADDLQYSNGVWRLTRSWLGAPNMHWDAELYS